MEKTVTEKTYSLIFSTVGDEGGTFHFQFLASTSNLDVEICWIQLMLHHPLSD